MSTSRNAHTTIHLAQPVSEFLRQRGARPGQKGAAHNMSQTLLRHVQRLEEALREADPRKSGFPEAYVAATVALLTEPWRLTATDIRYLDDFLRRLPRFAAVTERLGIDPAELQAAVQKLPYTERLALVDLAEQQHTQSHQEEP